MAAGGSREARQVIAEADGFGLYDLWEASPIRFEDDEQHTEEIVDALFPGNPLLCCGESNPKFDTRRREAWRGKLASLQLIVPSPMSALRGLTQDGRLSAHSLDNTGPRKYLVIEQDKGTDDEQVCERWVYSSCLCYGLDSEEQRRSRFRYQYSGYQLEYSRNLLFKRGATLDEVYQSMIERTRRLLDVDKLKTIFGWKHRPHRLHRGAPRGVRIERIVDETAYDVTVLKVHFGRLSLKIYDKGERVLRVEAIVHNVKDLRCGSILEKLPIMLAKLQRMAIDFLKVLQAAHRSFLEEGLLDTLPQPTRTGSRRLAGIDLQKPRMRTVTEAVLALAPKPGGFTAKELARKVNEFSGTASTYSPRQAAYDLSKLRGKSIIERVAHTRNYTINAAGIRALAGLLILREKVIRPVLAGICKPRLGRPPKIIHPIDIHYQNLRREMHLTLRHLALAA